MKNNSHDIKKLSIYIPGRFPSGRCFQELLAIVECSLVWSWLALASEAEANAWHKTHDSEGEKKDEYLNEYRKWDKVLDFYKKSYSKYISQKYISFVYDSQPSVFLQSPYDFRPLVKAIESIIEPLEKLSDPKTFLTLQKEVFKELSKEAFEKASRYVSHTIHSLSREVDDLADEIKDFHRKYDPESRLKKIIDKRHFEGEDFHINDFNDWIGTEFGANLLYTQAINSDRSIEFIFDI